MVVVVGGEGKYVVVVGDIGVGGLFGGVGVGGGFCGGARSAAGGGAHRGLLHLPGFSTSQAPQIPGEALSVAWRLKDLATAVKVRYGGVGALNATIRQCLVGQIRNPSIPILGSERFGSEKTLKCDVYFKNYLWSNFTLPLLITIQQESANAVVI